MPQQQQIDQRLARIRKMASLLDDRYRVPGTSIRFGLDSLIGLFPGVGDAVTTIAGVWLIGQAVRLNVPRKTLIRMIINLGLDSTLGAVPLLGDLFDLYWKSNRRNADIIERYLKQQGVTVPANPSAPPPQR